ncbi:MAG: hypothetical protein DMG45_25190, partial [Acidobacteria bacterium]
MHAVPALFAPGQHHIAVQSAARTTTIGVTAAPNDFIDITFDQRRAGQSHCQDLTQTFQQLEQGGTQAAEFFLTIIYLHVYMNYYMHN